MPEMSSKVRIACRRCRTKRIKCDGGIPACSNCQKANEACIDVDGRNNAVSIPRDFAANARARIEWLEDHIRASIPGFDLSNGPRVDFSFLDDSTSARLTFPHPQPHPDIHVGAAQPSPPDIRDLSTAQSFSTQDPTFDPLLNAALGKRGYENVSEQQPVSQEAFPEEARSVALDLGHLTLNSDSRQTHYLGTSSGRLFTSLIGAGSPDTPTQTGPRNRRTSQLSSAPSMSSPGISGQYAHAKRVKESYRALYDTLAKTLPAEEDTRLLLDVYFRNIHVDYPFIHPGSLLDAVAGLYMCAAVDAATTEIGYNGWVDTVKSFSYNGEFEVVKGRNRVPISVFTATFHVMMVFTLASTVRTRQRMYDFAPKQFYRVAMSIGPHCFSNTSTSSLQATLLLAAYSLLSPAELNIWTLTYVSMAHCVDLGLHRENRGHDGLSDVALLTRKMLFFSVYHLDRSVAAIQGRPLGIRDETFDVQLPDLSDLQADALAIEDKPFAPDMPFTGILAYAVRRFALDPIVSEIKQLFYHLPSQVSAYAWPSDHLAAQASIRERLDKWHTETLAIAGSMTTDSAEEGEELHKHELKLSSQYFAIMILLYQPSQTIPQPSEQSLLTCYQCATRRLNTYNDLYNADGYYQSWRSVQGVFSSGTTMIYCLWTSGLVRDTIPLLDAMKDLRTCTNLLSVGGEWWPSVKKGKESFGRAMDALLTKLQGPQPRDGAAPQKRRATSPGPRDDPSLPNEGTAVDKFDVAGHHLDYSQVHDIHHAIQSESGANFGQVPSDYGTTDWTAFGNTNSMYHPGGFDSHDLFAAQQDDPDATVEAFLADFLSGDTAWNPF